MTRSILLSSWLLSLPLLISTNWSYASEAAPTPSPLAVNLGATFDCTHNFNRNKGSTQGCVDISSINLALRQSLSPQVSALVILDPFGTPVKNRAHLPHLTDQESPGRDGTFKYALDFFRFNWRFRPSLDLRLEQFSGTASLPSTSGLAMASSMQGAPWDQLALVAEYHLPPLDGIAVTLALGNGEGERLHNMDPQQYGGIGILAGIMPGFKIKLGLSYDGNNYGSESFEWLVGSVSAEEPKLGFSTQRMVAALILDGNHPQARGLKGALGFQKTTKNDLSKNQHTLTPDFYASTSRRIDLNDLYVESPDDRAETLTHAVVAANFSFLVLAKYFVAFDYESRTSELSSMQFFIECVDPADPACQQVASQSNKIRQTSYTAGGGLLLSDGLRFSIEYASGSYDRLYKDFNFREGSERISKTRELIQARLTFQAE